MKPLATISFVVFVAATWCIMPILLAGGAVVTSPRRLPLDNTIPTFPTAPIREKNHHRRRRHHATTVFEITRRLNEHETVGTFCSTLGPVESYLTVEFFNLYDDDGFDYLSQNNGFRCVCGADIMFNTLEELTLKCSTMFRYDSDNFNSPPQSSVEVMVFTKTNDDDRFYPKSVAWYSYTYGGAFDENPIGEEYTFAPKDDATSTTDTLPYTLNSCSVIEANTECPGAICGICEGGRTIFRSDSSCYDIPCEENYTGSYLFDYATLNGPFGLTMYVDDHLRDCPSDGTLLVDDFCTNLDQVEAEATVTLRSNLNVFGFTLSGALGCACGEQDEFTMSLRCDYSYIVSFDGTEERVNGYDSLVYYKQGNYWIPSSTEWCDLVGSEPPYCEEHLLALGRNDLFSCNIAGCRTGFCELCPNGVNIGHSCNANATCADAWPGSVLFSYRNDMLGIPCPTSAPTGPPTRTPTISPTRSPTSSPTSPPTSPPTCTPTGTPTSPPTRSPTRSPTTLPTSAPTSPPTRSPTHIPTSPPTNPPSNLPSNSPTCSPTNIPTESPTRIAQLEFPTRRPQTNSPTSSERNAARDALVSSFACCIIYLGVGAVLMI